MIKSKKNTLNTVIKELNQFLANSFVLYLKTLNYHWNMVGPQFFMYHKLLEEQYKELADALDDLAERIRMLGALAPATMAEYAKLSTLKEGRSNLNHEQMVKDLIASHEAMVKQSQTLIESAEEENDQGTADLIIERLRAHDKFAWLLRSHFH